MNYKQAIEYMYSQLPMYHRVGAAAYKPGLDTTWQLMDIIGNPQQSLKCVHVAGTNGKGSTSHAIASVMQEAGYKTGLCTSPHLKDYRERIRINGEMIAEDEVIAFIDLFSEKWQSLQPSFFEMTIALAFWYFQKEQVDIAIIETGLGGRLDSTNVIVPEVAVITNIGLDHVQFLGDTLEKIASEKAGIIKNGIPVVLGKMDQTAQSVIEAKAKEKSAPVWNSTLQAFEGAPDFELKGNYQKENQRTAYAAIQALRQKGWQIEPLHISNGFSAITKNTGLLGRWQVLGYEPLIIADVGHNADGLRWVVDQLKELPKENLHVVIGVVNDKDLHQMLPLLPKNAKYYFCKADIPRGLDTNILMQQARQYELYGQVYDRVAKALEAAKSNATSKDVIFVGGSVFTVAEVV